MKQRTFHNNNKRSEILDTPTGYLINFYEDNVLVHNRILPLKDNPYIIAEDFVHDGDTAPKLLRD